VWLMLAATFIIAVSGVLMCAMRRTLVSRKSRKDRVAGNAEMSGENFYNRQNSELNAPRALSPPPLPGNRDDPMVNGSPGGDNLPSFAAYDSKPRMSGEDDRTPLNDGSRTGTNLSGDGMERYGSRGGMITQGRGGRGYGPQRDPYGNSMPPSYAYGPPGSAGRGSMVGSPYSGSPVRGRGGYGSPRGSFGPGRGGPYGGRGGPGMGVGAAMAGGAVAGGAMMGRGGRPSDQDYPPGSGRGAPSPYGAGYANAQSPYGRRPSEPRYGQNQSPGPPSGRGGYGYGGYNDQRPPSRDSFPRAESPPPMPGEERNVDPNAIGQAIAMTPQHGSPVHAQAPFTEEPHPLSDSEDEGDGYGVAGVRKKSEHSQSSAYSSQRNEYVTSTPAQTPLTNRSSSYGRPWATTPGRQGTPPMPGEYPQPSSARRSPPRVIQNSTPPPQRARVNSGDNYYEDVDARFAPYEQEATAPPPTAGMAPPPSTGLPMPTSLMPGTATLPIPRPHPLEQQRSYDSTQEGPESEASNFTSVSQRGVNPNWDGGGYRGGGGPGDYAYGGVPRRGPPQGQRDFGLSNNPDFEVPGVGPARRGGRMAGPGMAR
jgi:hypothetical protein